MFKTLLSCVGALCVAIIVGLLIRNTLRDEGARKSGPVHVIVAGTLGKDTIWAFARPEVLADYLVSAAQHDTSGVNRCTHSDAAVQLEAGTEATLEGYAGAGQAKLLITSGARRGSTLYASYAAFRGVDGQ